jgi:hypothetical protein
VAKIGINHRIYVFSYGSINGIVYNALFAFHNITSGLGYPKVKRFMSGEVGGEKCEDKGSSVGYYNTAYQLILANQSN